VTVPELPVPPDPAPVLDQLEPLCDPVRRSLYLYVAEQGHDVSRTEAAEALGIRRGLAAFHLDQLADAGLLEVEYRRMTGRSGPGAGRPAKLYRVAPGSYEVSFPPRNHLLLGVLFAEAIEGADDAGQAVKRRLLASAAKAGHSMGRAVRTTNQSRSTRQDRLEGVLARFGYRPMREGDELRLANCPYRPLADRHRSVVCEMNLALIDGAVRGAGIRAECRLVPEEDRCCVRTTPW
jgi:predicted ArsR family transcriptional regulator